MLEETACPSMPKHNGNLHARTTEIGRWLLKMGPPPERPNPQTARPPTTSCPLGFSEGYIGIMEKKMETTIMGLFGFRLILGSFSNCKTPDSSLILEV